MTAIYVLSSNAVQHPLLDCAGEYEQKTGTRVTFVFGATSDLRQKIDWEARGDVAVLTEEAMDALAQQDKIMGNTRMALARSPIAVAVRRGHPQPAIDTPENFKRALLGGQSVAYSRTGASGIYFAGLVERPGIAEQMKYILVAPERRSVADAVASGHAEIAIQQLSELLPAPGLEIVGPLPAELQKVTVFEAAGLACASESDAAAAFLAHLDASAPRLMHRHGLDPA